MQQMRLRLADSLNDADTRKLCVKTLAYNPGSKQQNQGNGKFLHQFCPDH
jgi:hypothetical protein